MAYGDHLQVRIEGWFGIPHHHGIEVENNQVIHYYKREQFHRPVLLKTSKADFSAGAAVYVVKHSPCHSAPVAAALAEFLLANHEKYKYSFFDMNCEHMANYCQVGHFKSDQIEHAELAAELTALAVLVGIVRRA